jgi:hypothetical protein
VVVGDHTNVRNIQTGVNSFLAPAHIRLRFDAALSLGPGTYWTNNQKFPLSPYTRTLDNGPDNGISVGASLEVKPPAFSLMEGLYAYSDRGDTLHPANLGDSRFNVGEPFGNICLLAGEKVGKGLLLVLGDTSEMMSLSIPATWPWFLEMARTGAAAQAPSLALSLLGFLLLGTGLVAAGKNNGFSLGVQGLLVWLILTGGWVWSRPRSRPPVNPEKIVWFENSHLENWQLASRWDWSPFTLFSSLLEDGFLPLYQKSWQPDLWTGTAGLVINGPRRYFPEHEVDDLQKFLENGGKLLLTVDARRAAAVRKLAERYDFSVPEIPLGTAEDCLTADHRPAGFNFIEAWPLLSTAFPETLLTVWGYPLALRRTVGTGLLTILGDEHFLSRYSLEGPGENAGPPVNATRFRNAPSRSRNPAGSNDDPAREKYLREFGDQLVPKHHPERTLKPENREGKLQFVRHTLLGGSRP